MIPVMKLRLGSPDFLIDINRVPGLDRIKVTGGRINMGALARHHDLETSKVIRDKAWIISEAASTIGDPQVRNMGTIGGSLAHCDPSGDLGAVVTALRGEVILRGPSKARRLRIDDFLLDTFTSALRTDEVLTEVRVPIPPPRSGGAYLKLERKTGDFATAGVAVQLSLDRNGVCVAAGIGLTALGPKNLRAAGAEEVMVGRQLTVREIEEAAAAASEDSQPTNDPLRGSAEYKKEMARVFTRRAILLAVSRAQIRRA